MPESANEHLVQLEGLLKMSPPASILDVGMGRGNYGWWLRNTARWTGNLIGIDVWAPYISGAGCLAGGNLSHYNETKVLDVRDAAAFVEEKAPDLVFAFDVLEHLPPDEAVKVLRMLQRASRQGVLVSLPIIPYPQGPLHGNPHETHLKDWTAEEMVALGSEFVHRGQATGLFHFPGGKLDRRISVILNTARDNASFENRHDILNDPAEALSRQTISPAQIELIVVDGLHFDRWKMFEAHQFPFRILHVPPKQSQMVKDRRCAISAYKNTGLAHMRAPLAVTIDDGAILPARYLENVCEAWEVRRELLSALYPNTQDDSRKIYLDASGKCVGPIHGDVMQPPMHGFAALPLEAVLAVNGYDEMFDGSRGLEDMDMGIRLQKAGYRISLDARHVNDVAPHGPWSVKVFGDNVCGVGSTHDDTCVKCCQATFRLRSGEILSGDYQANRRPWGPDKWSQIAPRCYLLRDSHCSLNGHPCPHLGTLSDREHPGLKSQIDNPPIFDLREERVRHGIRG